MKKSVSKTIQKITLFVVSIIVKMSSTILIGFTIPRLLGVVQFGYFRIYALYAVYGSLLHVGLIDGFFLSHRESNADIVKKQAFQQVAKTLLWLEGLLGSLGILTALIFLKGEMRLILTLVFLNLLVQNFITLYQTWAQINKQSSRVSQGSLFLSFLNILIVAAVFLCPITSYFWFTLLVVIANVWVAFWFFWIYRRILVASPSEASESQSRQKSFSRVGLLYLFAYSLPMIVVAVNDHFVLYLFDIHDFSIYSFSINMTIFATVACASLCKISDLYLLNVSRDKWGDMYSLMNGVVIFLVLLGISAYFLLQWTTPTFLPDYIAAIPIFRIVLGALLFSCPIGVVTHAFFKLHGKNRLFLYFGLCFLVLSIGINLGVFFLFGTLEAMALSLLCILGIWYVGTQIVLIQELRIPWIKSDLFLLIGGMIYLGFSAMEDYRLGAVLYLAAIVVLFFVFYGNERRKGMTLYRMLMNPHAEMPASPEVGS
jgi:O-antigen/teichoic acid export membrane protein